MYNLIEIVWLRQTYQGPQVSDTCVENTDDFKQYDFNSIPVARRRWLMVTCRPF